MRRIKRKRKSRIDKEKALVERMIRLYCRHAESNSELCNSCKELIIYAHRKLDLCRYGNAKGNCSNCTLHCYAPKNREKIRQVMRYVGPRMIILSPLDFWQHLWQSMTTKKVTPARIKAPIEKQTKDLHDADHS